MRRDGGGYRLHRKGFHAVEHLRDILIIPLLLGVDVRVRVRDRVGVRVRVRARVRDRDRVREWVRVRVTSQRDVYTS